MALLFNPLIVSPELNIFVVLNKLKFNMLLNLVLFKLLKSNEEEGLNSNPICLYFAHDGNPSVADVSTERPNISDPSSDTTSDP